MLEHMGIEPDTGMFACLRTPPAPPQVSRSPRREATRLLLTVGLGEAGCELCAQAAAAGHEKSPGSLKYTKAGGHIGRQLSTIVPTIAKFPPVALVKRVPPKKEHRII